MFHNLLVPNLVPLHIKNELQDWENQPFSAVWPEKYDTNQSVQIKFEKKIKEETITKTIFKKKKRFRTAFTTQQLLALEDVYRKRKYIDGESRRKLAKRLNIADASVKTWFQNRRMKEKREDTENSDTSSEGQSTTHHVQYQQSNQDFDPFEQDCKQRTALDLSQIPENSGINWTNAYQNPPEYNQLYCNTPIDFVHTQKSPYNNYSILPSASTQCTENLDLGEKYPSHETSTNADTIDYQLQRYMPSYDVSKPTVTRDFYQENTVFPTQYYPMNSDYFYNSYPYYEHINDQNFGY